MILLAKKKKLTVDSEALEKLVTDGHSLAYGARFLKRHIENKIKIPISRKLADCAEFHILVKDNNIVVEANGTEVAAGNSDVAIV